MTGNSYIRKFDAAKMVEIEPGWYVNAAVWALLFRAGVTSITKKESE